MCSTFKEKHLILWQRKTTALGAPKSRKLWKNTYEVIWKPQDLSTWHYSVSLTLTGKRSLKKGPLKFVSLLAAGAEKKVPQKKIFACIKILRENEGDYIILLSQGFSSAQNTHGEQHTQSFIGFCSLLFYYNHMTALNQWPKFRQLLHCYSSINWEQETPVHKGRPKSTIKYLNI